MLEMVAWILLFLQLYALFLLCGLFVPLSRIRQFNAHCGHCLITVREISAILKSMIKMSIFKRQVENRNFLPFLLLRRKQRE